MFKNIKIIRSNFFHLLLLTALINITITLVTLKLYIIIFLMLLFIYFFSVLLYFQTLEGEELHEVIMNSEDRIGFYIENDEREYQDVLMIVSKMIVFKKIRLYLPSSQWHSASHIDYLILHRTITPYSDPLEYDFERDTHDSDLYLTKENCHHNPSILQDIMNAKDAGHNIYINGELLSCDFTNSQTWEILFLNIDMLSTY